MFLDWNLTISGNNELAVFNYFVLLILTLALAFLPTAQLALSNPLMPAGVSLGRFLDVSISTGIFGELCA